MVRLPFEMSKNQLQNASCARDIRPQKMLFGYLSRGRGCADGRFPDDPTVESCGSCAEMLGAGCNVKDPRRNSNVTGHPVEPASPSRCNETRAAQQPPRRARSNCDYPRLGGDRACTLTVPVQWDLTESPWRRAPAPRRATSAPCAKVRRITLRKQE